MLALDESPSSLQLWSLELKVKLYITGKSWEMNQMLENENEYGYSLTLRVHCWLSSSHMEIWVISYFQCCQHSSNTVS